MTADALVDHPSAGVDASMDRRSSALKSSPTVDPARRIARATFGLRPLAPFRLDLTVWALRRRPDNAVDLWDGTTYRRVIVADGTPIDVSVTQSGSSDAPTLRVTAWGPGAEAGVRRRATATLERMLGLRTDLTEFYRLASRDPVLNDLVQRFRGVKPPRLSTPFEALVNAIACQQITLTQGIRLLNRLAETYGPVGVGGEPGPHALPGPADLAPLDPDELRQLGFSRQKARTLVDTGRAITEGRFDLDGIAELDDAAAVARLCELRGVGRWTAEYVLLRGLGRTEIFPGDDVGARKNLQRWLGLPSALDYEGVRETVARWQPYAGLIYFHLLLDRLSERGNLAGSSASADTGSSTIGEEEP